MQGIGMKSAEKDSGWINSVELRDNSMLLSGKKTKRVKCKSPDNAKIIF